ncbi:MAG: phage major capsid protein [Oceanicaulis sp.]
MKLKELRERLAALKKDGRTKAKAFDALDAKTDRTDAETAEMAALSAAIEQLTADIEACETEIAAAEARLDRDRLFAGGASDPGAVDAGQAIEVVRPYEAGQRLRPSALGAARAHDPDPVLMGGFHSAAEFASSVRAAIVGGSVDERLTASVTGDNTHTTGGPNGEGYMVPPAIRETIWEVVFADDGLLNRFDPEPTASNTVEGGADETTPWGAAGVQAGWAGELSEMAKSKLSTEGRAVKLHKLYALVTASDELLSDAPLLENRLTRKAGEAIRYAAVESFINGNGKDRPLGFRQSQAVINVTKKAGQAADTIVAENIFGLMSRCFLGPRSFFMCGQDALPQLGVMTIGDNIVYTPPSPDNFARGVGGFINGIPLVYSQHAEKLGDAGDFTLINPAGYASYSKREQIKFASSIHLYFDRDAAAFRWTFRLGGQPHLSAPISSDKGKPSMSHFVQIAARA